MPLSPFLLSLYNPWAYIQIFKSENPKFALNQYVSSCGWGGGGGGGDTVYNIRMS